MRRSFSFFLIFAPHIRILFDTYIEDCFANAVSSDINALILDYLTVAGYPNAAAKFSTEANLSPQQPSSSIYARQQIQTFIHKGEIESALHALNDLDPSVRTILCCTISLHYFAVIKTRVYMHHSYGLRVTDEEQPLFL